jgi:hypothetical protein
MKHNIQYLLSGLFTFIIMGSYGQVDINSGQKMTRQEKKVAEKKQNEDEWKVLQKIAEDKTYIVQFSRYTNTRNGKIYNLNRRLNFIAVNGNRVIIQIETNQYLSDNGLGGVTIDGTLSDYKYQEPKNNKGAIKISFNVSSETTFRGSNINITVGKDGFATITLGNSPLIVGDFMLPQESNINLGVTFWN